jgi:hypothetical protein
MAPQLQNPPRQDPRIRGLPKLSQLPIAHPKHQKLTAVSRRQKKTSVPFRAGSLDVPKQLVGSWRGRMRQGEGPSLQIYPMTLKLRSASNDVGVTGRSDYPTPKCAGNILLTEVSADTVRLTEKITEGTGCIYTVYFKVRLSSTNRIKLTFSSEYEGYPEGSAMLTRDGS